MEIKILNEGKEFLDIELSSLTIAELLRAYLVENGAKMAAWKRETPQENPVLHLEADSPKKVLSSTIEKISKELDKASDEFRKSK